MPPADAKLYLQSFLLKKGSGITLNEQVGSVRQFFLNDPDLLVRFQSLLLNAGYSSDDADKYTQMYSVSTEKMFLVDQNFPCIHRGNVPPAVQSARYTLDINRIQVSGCILKDFCEGVKNGIE